MQYKQCLFLLTLCTSSLFASAQNTYLPMGAHENILIERMEIKAGRDTNFNYSRIRPLSRKHMIPALTQLDTAGLSRVDRYNLYLAKINNLEWVPESWENYRSRKTPLKGLYQTPATLFEVHEPNFFLAVNPVFQYTLSREQNNNSHLFQNTRGVSLRGRIADKIGFFAYVTDNQERPPAYVQQFTFERRAVPGNGYFKTFKALGGVDYFDARGYITFNAAKVIDVSFGYDRNFIGAGQRSLLLSDFSAPTVFLRLNTRIWKFHYQNLFMELNHAQRISGDLYRPKKYAALHYLDLGVTKWLNIGLFEGIIFGRTNRFEFGYLNPVIFYRSIEHQNGSVDNAVAGLDVKANVAHRFQFYGQLLLDEFKLGEIRRNRGWIGNKFGFQLGAKYIDAFNIRNLDLQVEMNRIRPFTYSHNDSVANYTHYNQPLAHPLGANFQELLVQARYQPAPKWLLLARGMYYLQGRDTGRTAFGGNIFLPNVRQDAAVPSSIPRPRNEYGYQIGNGQRNQVALASLLVSYQIRPNLFLETNALYRHQNVALPTGNGSAGSFIGTVGIRWNMDRRDFLF